jgi:hypothetical protein
MSLEIVNGYVCRDCTDVARAKKGEDPASKPLEAKPQAPGTVATDEERRGLNRPLASGARGTSLNLLL